MLPRAREHGESRWRDLACRTAKQVKCSVSEIWKRKRPRCSVKTRRVIKLLKSYTCFQDKYTILKESSWRSTVEGMRTDKAAADGNLFTGIFTCREALDNAAVQLTLLGFDDLVKTAEERLSRKERSNADKVWQRDLPQAP